MLHDELFSQLSEKTAVGITHTHYGFINIEPLSLQTAKLIPSHQISIGFSRIKVGHSLDNLAINVGRERCNAVCQTFLNEVVT